MARLRIGAYGGTFDPIHQGHVEAARAITLNFGLDVMLVIPAATPPHKDPRSVSRSHHRYAMAVTATLDLPRVLVSTIEIENPDEPYTYSTLDRLRTTYGQAEDLFFVVGADAFQQIRSWREPARLLAVANLIVVSRPGYELDVEAMDTKRLGLTATATRPEAAASGVVAIVDVRGQAGSLAGEVPNKGTVYLTDYVSRGISSTEIRDRVRNNRSIQGLVPVPVANYIEKYGLYKRA